MTPEASADLLAFFFLLFVDLLRVVLVLFVAWLLVPQRPQCPQCRHETSPVEGSFLLRWLLLQRRWCMACGWTGLARRATLLQSAK